jgi:hypothetical protein
MVGIHLALLTMPHHPLVVPPAPAKQNAWHICNPECNAHAMAVLHGAGLVHSLAMQAKKNAAWLTYVIWNTCLNILVLRMNLSTVC